MDERLVEHYNTELRHLREMSAEFAREFPKIAGRLSLDKEAKEICPDPYVERLLEGFAYLAARVHLKLDAEFPRFTQALLETVYPHYLAPIPSMAIVRFDPEEQDSGLATGVNVPRDTILRSNLGKGDRTACTFRTAHNVRLLPIKITEVTYFTRDVASLKLPEGVAARAAIRIRLQATAGLTFDKIKLDPLTFYLRGADEFPASIYEQIFAHKTGLVIQSAAAPRETYGVGPASCIQRVGFGNEEALLPVSPCTFEGYRLLREYFAFPQRFLFFQLAGFAEALTRCKASQIDLVITLDEQDTRLENRLDATNFELFCTPAINLFRKTLDRINLSDRFSEFHVVPDRNRPLDFEVYEIKSVTGFGMLAGQEQEFRPFYLAKDADIATGAFFTTNRVPRVLTAKEKQFGKESSYSGTEVFLSLVDATASPYKTDLRQLGLEAFCTNRHLPNFMPLAIGRSDFSVEASAPITGVRCLGDPTKPQPSLAEGRFAWRLISHLSLNYLSLLDSDTGEGAVALREILKLYSDSNDRQIARQIEGLRTARVAPVLRRVQTPGPITFARGLQVEIKFDEAAFEGTGVFILGAVLEQFFAKYVSLNSFTETVIVSQQRGEIMRWPAQLGRRQII